MRRDVNPLLKWLIYFSTRSRAIGPGFLTSQNAAYTVQEIEKLLRKSNLKSFSIQKDFFGLSITGKNQ